jgi:DNA-binding transcriptional MerR regulator
MAADTFDIQELVNASGVPRRTIYFYVQQGLLPPPQGAGLAAYYTPAHLLRLQLIPVLRRQGLRLDEIRRRFGEMTEEEMRRELAAQEAARQIAEKKEPYPPGAPVAFTPLIRPAEAETSPRLPLSPSPHLPSPAFPRPFLHYPLPAGITLVAPDDLSPTDRVRLEQVLQAARQIFSSSPFLAEDRPGRPGDPADGSSRPQEV